MVWGDYISFVIRDLSGVALQVLELVILAVLAAVVLFQLYAVLGRRVGRGPGDLQRAQTAPAALETSQRIAGAPDEAAPLTGLAAVKARDPAFDVGHFLQGARQAYQMIVTAFAKGDRAVLKPLLSPQVMEGFEAEISRRESEGVSESVDFIQPPRADFEGVDLFGDIVKASVRFLAEFRSRSTGPQGEAVDDKRTAEVWTFERNLKSRDPNWTLIHVDAAEA
ncbi:MAG TPA: TIM44-related membrane protein TimA [Caulobacteraceae bacterium]